VGIQFKELTDQGRSFQEMLERLRTVADACYHLHVRCFAAWEFERTEVGQNGQVTQIGQIQRRSA
jgi:hypothetical protein